MKNMMAWEVGRRKYEESVTFKRVFNSCRVSRLASSDSRLGPVVDICEHSNELSGSTKGDEFHEHLSYFQLLRDDSPPWT
jgi:hypothetical protein